MLKLGLSCLAFGDYPLFKAFEGVSSLGFAYTDIGAMRLTGRGFYQYYCHIDPKVWLQTDYLAILKEKLDYYGLEVCTLNGPRAPINDPDESVRRKAIDLVKSGLELASRLDARGITTSLGTLLSSEKSVQISLKSISECVSFAEDLGVFLNIEIHVPHGTHLHDCLLSVDTVEKATKLMDMSPKRFSICLDARHIGAARFKGWSNYDVVEAVKKLQKDLTHVHLWDNLGCNILVSPGKGETDFAAMAEALTNIGYNGVSVIEGEYFRWNLADIEKELMECKHYLGTCGFGAFWG